MTPSSPMPTAKRIPQRTCVGCRVTGGKRDFVRVVKTPDGSVQIDPDGKANGRGAYICGKPSCWEEALTKERLARALRTAISPDVRAELRRFGEHLKLEMATLESHASR